MAMNPERQGREPREVRTRMLQVARGLRADLKAAATGPWRSLARMPKPEMPDPEAAAVGHECCESWDHGVS